MLIDLFFKLGSSPRVWGQVSEAAYKTVKDRIIPTRVGTSRDTLIFAAILQDHPHACGDKAIALERCFLITGSSPRVWGQEIHAPKTKYKERIIPTRVGTRHCRRQKSVPCTDHPHACGDKCGGSQGISQSRGSSPRVWGQDTSANDIAGNTRIIPTRVGTRQCL